MLKHINRIVSRSAGTSGRCGIEKPDLEKHLKPFLRKTLIWISKADDIAGYQLARLKEGHTQDNRSRASLSVCAQFGLDLCCAIVSAGLNTVSGLLKNVVAKPLSAIQQLRRRAADFEPQVIGEPCELQN